MIINKNSDYATVIPKGQIDITNSGELKEALLALMDEGFNMITLDFTNVNAIDSSGLGKLLLFQNKLRERQGELQIINVHNDYIRKMFSMIYLYKVIKIEGLA